jgi:dihydroorotase
MRRAMEYASGLGVTLAQHCEVTALSAGTHMHEGSGRARLGLAGPAAEAEELMVSATSPWPASPAPGSTSSTCRPPGRSSWWPRQAAGPAVTAEATPHHFTLTDAECGRLRPGVQGEPAAAHRRRRRRGAPGLPTGDRRHRHRPRPPHRPRRRSAPSTRRRRGCWVWRPRWRWPSPSWSTATVDPPTCSARCPGARRRSPVWPTPRRPVEAGAPANLCVSTRRPPGPSIPSGGRPAAAATTPTPGMDVTGRVRHTLFGSPVVIDGEAQR